MRDYEDDFMNWLETLPKEDEFILKLVRKVVPDNWIHGWDGRDMDKLIPLGIENITTREFLSKAGSAFDFINQDRYTFPYQCYDVILIHNKIWKYGI